MKRTTIMNHFTQVSLHVLSRSGDLLGAFHRQQVEEIPFAKRVYLSTGLKKKKRTLFLNTGFFMSQILSKIRQDIKIRKNGFLF